MEKLLIFCQENFTHTSLKIQKEIDLEHSVRMFDLYIKDCFVCCFIYIYIPVTTVYHWGMRDINIEKYYHNLAIQEFQAQICSHYIR
jgi:hypothetical protein